MVYDESHFPKECVVRRSPLQERGRGLVNFETGTVRFACPHCGEFRMVSEEEADLDDELRT
jgi:predicted RNA-binding Zn-ribbon protein involved in translation (DUF1610 family)